jgi:DNA-binding NarL/FixJ family response regulator
MLDARGASLWAVPKERDNGAVGVGVLPNSDRHLLLVCKSNLERECLFNGLLMNGLKMPVTCYAFVEKAKAFNGSAVILLHIGAKRLADPFFSEEIRSLVEMWSPSPIVLLAEREEWAQVVRAMEIGARGYIPTSVDVRVCVEAIHLASAGGMYIPASMAIKSPPPDIDEDVLGELLTAREIEVVHAIRIGRSNKVIAFELGMSEGTVKAHVHNIMRKIGAANRTEVACKLHNMYNSTLGDD